MSNLRQIQIVNCELDPERVRRLVDAGTIWCKLSGIPEDGWENDFIGAYDHLIGDDSNRQYAQNIPRDHQDLINQSGHIYVIKNDEPYIVIPVRGISIDEIKDWLTSFIKECATNANAKLDKLRTALKLDAQDAIIENWPNDGFKKYLSMDLAGEIVELLWERSSYRYFRDLVIEKALKIQRLSECCYRFPIKVGEHRYGYATISFERDNANIHALDIALDENNNFRILKR